jgi:hypothetical protein
MLEMDADVPRESFKARLMGRLRHAAARMKVHAVISTKKYEEEKLQDNFSESITCVTTSIQKKLLSVVVCPLINPVLD